MFSVEHASSMGPCSCDGGGEGGGGGGGGQRPSCSVAINNLWNFHRYTGYY